MTPYSHYTNPTKDGDDGQRELRKQTNKQTNNSASASPFPEILSETWRLSIVEPQAGSQSFSESSDVMSSVEFAWCCRARLQASSVLNIRRRRKQPESDLSTWTSEASRERASERARGVGGWGVWEGWEKKESSPFLPAPRCRVSSHVPLVRVLFTISPNGKLAFMLGRMLAQPC